MREVVCFGLIYIFVNSVEAVKSKSVNLALETVLRFDKKDRSADVEVLDKVQNFLDNIKHAMTSGKSAKRRSNSKDLKFTDFLLEAAEVLNSYDDNDLEDFFAVLDDQSRKYNYKGCKFYELVDNNDVRRYMSNKLEEVKDSSAKTMRRYLKEIVKIVATEDYNDRHRGTINLVNSLYDGASNKFENVVNSLKSYRTRAKDSSLNLEDIVSNALRKLFFDHYSNLNNNARQHLKSEVGKYWVSHQYDVESKKERHGKHNKGIGDDSKEESQDHKSKLRVIDVPSKFSNKKVNKSDRLKIKSKKIKEHKKDKRHKSRKPTSKIDIDFFNFKSTTRDQPAATSDEDSTKRNDKQYAVTRGINDDDIISNSYELKEPTNSHKTHKAIIPTKPSDEKSASDSDNSSRDSIDKEGISIEFANEKYMSKQKKKHTTTRHKKEKIDHITYDVERRLKMKAHDYTDVESSDKDSEDDKGDSNEEVTNHKETVQEDLDESGVLIGGQNIQEQRYRAEHRPRSSKIKRKDINVHKDNFDLPPSIKKLNDRPTSHHKPSIKTKGKKKTTPISDADEQLSKKLSGTRDSKDSAFASSDEGITIETFENDNLSERKYSNLRKANEPTTGSDVHQLIYNLEKQLEDVKEQVRLVAGDKGNNTEKDALAEAKGEASDNKNNKTEEILSDKAYEIRVYSGTSNTTKPETTKTRIINNESSTVEHEAYKETKPNRTTMQETNDVTITSSIGPILRSNIDVDQEKNQQSNEKDTAVINTLKDHKITEAVKDLKTATLNVADSIFKTSDEKSVTALRYEERRNGNENITLAMLPGEEENETSLNKDAEKTAQTVTTTIDLTKNPKDSDTVVENMKEKPDQDIEDMKKIRDDLEDFALPKPPGLQEKLDVINDLDENFDIMP